MTEFMSPQWFEDFAATVGAATCPSDARLTIAQTITDAPGRGWTIRIADGRAVLETSADPEADIRLSADTNTAREIHHGRVSAQRAFLDGHLRIGGDIAALMAHRAELDAIGLGAMPST